MKILHISAECYPAAKAGGLGDVSGALPKYLNDVGMDTGVVMPRYHTRWLNEQSFTPVYKGAVRLHLHYVPFSIEKIYGDPLGFPLYVVNVPYMFDRPGIYIDPGTGEGYRDNLQRYLVFQQAVLQWILHAPGKPALLHCHDHHTGLIPFFIKYAPEYQALADIPTVFTIHNGEYHGSFSWENMYLLPYFLGSARGLLDWSNLINPLATGIKTSWRVTTVSPTYLQELMQHSNGMEWLLQHERYKSVGILNGIDTKVWDPETDRYIVHHLIDNDWEDFKQSNKQALLQAFSFDPALPLITFIGRLAREKGGDMLPDLIQRVLSSGMQVNILVLGTGDSRTMDRLNQLSHQFRGRFDVALQYNESIAHQLYAGSDFIFMPSRVEPCGLNQMYAMRYGTIPIVRTVGGLKDTVIDIGMPDGSGRGIRFDQFSVEDAHHAVYRALELYHQPEVFRKLRENISALDFSWEQSARQYRDIYESLISFAV